MENSYTIQKIACLEKSSNKVLNFLINIKIGTYIVLSNEKIIEKGWDSDRINLCVSRLTNTDSESYFHEIAFISEDNSIYITASKNTEVYNFVEWTGENDPINDPSIDAIYDESKNAFIRPCPVEGYILNESTFEWQPDPEITYDLHGDGKHYRYDVENNCWWPTW